MFSGGSKGKERKGLNKDNKLNGLILIQLSKLFQENKLAKKPSEFVLGKFLIKLSNAVPVLNEKYNISSFFVSFHFSYCYLLDYGSTGSTKYPLHVCRFV